MYLFYLIGQTHVINYVLPYTILCYLIGQTHVINCKKKNILFLLLYIGKDSSDFGRSGYLNLIIELLTSYPRVFYLGKVYVLILRLVPLVRMKEY